jgi:cytochrome c-type biogenesis protein CcmH/NrfG
MITVRDVAWFVAGVLVALAAALVARRWLPHTGARLAIRRLQGAAFGALILAVLTLVFYAWRGNSDQSMTALGGAAPAAAVSAAGGEAHAGGSLTGVLAQLEGRLRGGGGSASDWALLAQTYDYLGRKSDASNARNRHAVASSAMPGSGDEQWPLILAALDADNASSAVSTAVTAGTAEATPAIARQPAGAQTRQLVQQLLSAADQARRTQNYAAAKSSYEQVAALGQMSAQNWADYADVVAALNGGKLDSLAQRYIEAALDLDPANEKALWLKASAQHDDKHYALAVSTWAQLLALTPAGSTDAKTFADNLQEDQRLANAGAERNDTAVDHEAPQNSSSPVQVSGEVTLAESLKMKVPPGLTLFIVAKSINSPGPPVAVVRTQTGQWPLKFMLDDSLAILPERKLSTAGAVMIEARVSQSGTAASHSGDFKSTPAVVDPHAGRSVHLVIDHIIG